MIIELTEQQSYYFFSEDMELLFAAQNILIGEPIHNLCSKIYGTERIALWKVRYSFLFEVFSALDIKYSYGIFEHLLHYPLNEFSLESYRDFLLNLEPEDFLIDYLRDIPREEVAAARRSEERLQLLYEEHSDISKSYLGFSALLQNTRRLIHDFVSFATQLNTEEFKREIRGIDPKLRKEQERMIAVLQETDPLNFSEQLMGKTFHNRGPYHSFIFSPSLFMPYRAVRFFEDNQILFYTLRNTALKDEDVQKQLKAISDATRFRIMDMLNKNGSMRGMDIAAALSIAASTVSHHMEILYTSGLINEEQEKNTKYYSIARNSIELLLKRLADTLTTK